MATMSVSCLTIDGEVIAEDRNGVPAGYIPHSLGNTAALVGSGQAITDTDNYWPYGEIRVHNGSSVSAFTYAGTKGYYQDAVNDRCYVYCAIVANLEPDGFPRSPFFPLGIISHVCVFECELACNTPGVGGFRWHASKEWFPC